MNNTLKIGWLVFFTLMCTTLFAQKSPQLTRKDLRNIAGNWEGSLTYLDYSSNEPFTMQANVRVEYSKKNNCLIFHHSYPKEPSANSSDTVEIAQHTIDGLSIVSRVKMSGKKVAITTEEMGVDGNDDQDAMIKHIYVIGSDELIVRKEVQFIGENSYIMRYEYRYKRS